MFIIQPTTYSATLSNLFLWKQRAHNKPGSIPPPPHKRSLALLHKNTARCAGHCFITIDITEKCCPITKTTVSRILSQVITDNIPFPWCLCTFFLIEVEVCYVQNTLLCRRLFLTSTKCLLWTGIDIWEKAIGVSELGAAWSRTRNWSVKLWL